MKRAVLAHTSGDEYDCFSCHVSKISTFEDEDCPEREVEVIEQRNIAPLYNVFWIGLLVAYDRFLAEEICAIESTTIGCK